MSAIRDLVDLSLVVRLTDTDRRLVNKWVNDFGPPPVGRFGRTRVWNSQDLDALITAVERGRSAGKPVTFIYRPDESDAMASRVWTYKNGKQEPMWMKSAEVEETKIETLGSIIEVMELQPAVERLRELCEDEIELAHKSAELMRACFGIDD